MSDTRISKIHALSAYNVVRPNVLSSVADLGNPLRLLCYEAKPKRGDRRDE